MKLVAQQRATNSLTLYTYVEQMCKNKARGTRGLLLAGLRSTVSELQIVHLSAAGINLHAPHQAFVHN